MSSKKQEVTATDIKRQMREAGQLVRGEVDFFAEHDAHLDKQALESFKQLADTDSCFNATVSRLCGEWWVQFEEVDSGVTMQSIDKDFQAAIRQAIEAFHEHIGGRPLID